MQYRANGGSIFKPKGTDTVPAMLTPGEFVIRRSAVNKIGADRLAQLNRGDATVAGGGATPRGYSTGGVIYRPTGSNKPEENPPEDIPGGFSRRDLLARLEGINSQASEVNRDGQWGLNIPEGGPVSEAWGGVSGFIAYKDFPQYPGIDPSVITPTPIVTGKPD